MRKSSYFFAALAALFTIGCSQLEKPGEETILPNDNGQYTISLGIPETRVALDDDLMPFWTDGDKLAVQTNNSYSSYTLSSGKGTNSGSFTGNGTPKNGGVLVYPGSNFSNGTYTFPTSFQFAKSDDSGNVTALSTNASLRTVSNVPMAGNLTYSNNKLNGSLRFIGGAIKIHLTKNVPYTATYMDVEVFEGNITGSATVSGTDPISNTSLSNGGKKVRVQINQTGQASSTHLDGITVYIPVPTGHYKGLRVALVREDGRTEINGTKIKSESVEFDIAAGEIQPFTFTPKYEVFTFQKITRSQDLTDGTYILVYDPAPNSNSDRTVIVNGDDNLRESFQANFYTTYTWKVNEQEYTANNVVVLEEADYITGAWVLEYDSGNWDVKYGKGTLEVNSVSFSNNNVMINVYGRYPIRYVYYYTYDYTVNHSNVQPQGWDPSNLVKYGNGHFLIDASSTSNIYMYKMLN